MNDTINISEMLETCRRATPGPWTDVDPGKDENGFPIGITVAATERGSRVYSLHGGGSSPYFDRQYIAACSPDRVKRLLLALRELCPSSPVADDILAKHGVTL